MNGLTLIRLFENDFFAVLVEQKSKGAFNAFILCRKKQKAVDSEIAESLKDIAVLSY